MSAKRYSVIDSLAHIAAGGCLATAFLASVSANLLADESEQKTSKPQGIARFLRLETETVNAIYSAKGKPANAKKKSATADESLKVDAIDVNQLRDIATSKTTTASAPPQISEGEKEPARLPNGGKALPLGTKPLAAKPLASKQAGSQDDGTLELGGTDAPKTTVEDSAPRVDRIARRELPKSSEPTQAKEDQAGESAQKNGSKSAEEKVTSQSVERHSIPDGPATLQLGEPDGVIPHPTEDRNECPGAPKDGVPAKQEVQPDDVPLEQEAHPFDAPAAKSVSDVFEEDEADQLSMREIAIRDRINTTLSYFLDHPETVVRRGPWALMHATLPFGVETEVVAGNRRVNAIGWMCYNGVCAKQRMFQATRTGFRTNVGPGVQGHEGQFLAILAQSKVQADYPIRVGRRQFTIQDLVRYEMSTCREKSELTFKLIGLSYYLKPDQRWRDSRGRYWNLEKMVGEELAQPINGAACGGTHRLMGLTFSLFRRQEAGLPITGHWARAEKYLNDYVNYAMTLQNPDGSFSTEWFESRGRDPDVERKVQTTGHIVEWLIYTLPQEHLRSERIQASVEFLLDSVGENVSHDWPIGPRGHALRALVLYNQRVFGAEPGQTRAFIANTRASNLR